MTSPWRRPARAMLAAAMTAAVMAAGLLAGASPAAAALPPAWSLRPYVNCVWNNHNGTYTVSLGYQSYNTTNVTVPTGTNNKITPGTPNQGQPTTFAPGVHDNVWALTLTSSAYTTGQWVLMSAAMNMTMNGTACSTKPVPLFTPKVLIYMLATGPVAIGGGFALIRRRRRRLETPDSLATA